MTVFHSYLPYQFLSIVALSCFTCFILHASRVCCDSMRLQEWELCMYMHILKACMCMHVTWHAACVCTYQELRVHLYSLACIKVQVFICIWELSAWASRGEPLLACFKHWVFIFSIFTYLEHRAQCYLLKTCQQMLISWGSSRPHTLSCICMN
jgi:hypothetical protein